MAIGKFSPSMLSNLDELRTLFTGEKELQEIQDCIQDPSSRYSFGLMRRVRTVLSAPFISLCLAYIEPISNTARSLQKLSLSRRLSILASLLRRDRLYLQQRARYGKNLITPAENVFQFNIKDVYNQLPISPNVPLDPRIRRAVLKEDLFKKDLYSYREGLCGGSSYWFIFLFKKAIERGLGKNLQLSDFTASIAQQFVRGIPRPAALLQTFFKLKESLLDMPCPFPLYIDPLLPLLISKVVCTYLVYPLVYPIAILVSKIMRIWNKSFVNLFAVIYNMNFLTSFSVREFKENKTVSLEKLKNLENGIYFVRLSTHAVVYLKHNKEQFLWDSNVGLLKIEHTEDLLSSLSPYIESKKPDEEILFQNHLKLSRVEDGFKGVTPLISDR